MVNQCSEIQIIWEDLLAQKVLLCKSIQSKEINERQTLLLLQKSKKTEESFFHVELE